MPVRLIDLQLIYGIAGARETFEDVVAQIVNGEYPDVGKVRVVKGDGGIDAYVGDIADISGIDVYQCKFFPYGLDDSQKGQIRESFKRCRDNKEFSIKSWTLCLPVDLSVDEKKWFEEWKSKQAISGIDICPPWGALKLEGLLYQPKHRGVKETFFKEEYLTQIRDMHGMMQKLVKRVEELFQASRSDQDMKQADVIRRQADVLTSFVESLRKHYREAANQAASAKRVPLPSHWEVVIRPSDIGTQQEMTTLKTCRTIVQNCQVRSNGWEYPPLVRQFETGDEWTGATYRADPEVECWRLSQRGAFIHMFPIFDDLQTNDEGKVSWQWQVPKGFAPKRFFGIDAAVRTITHVFRFASNLVKQSEYPGTNGVDVSIRLTGTTDRVLTADRDPRRVRTFSRATVSSLEKNWPCTTEQLCHEADMLAVKAAVWFFERFNWDGANDAAVEQLQQSIFVQH